MTAGQDAVRLSRVTRLFDGLAAVSNVSLEIAGGETVWLRGWNGSGKTTLELRAAARPATATWSACWPACSGTSRPNGGCPGRMPPGQPPSSKRGDLSRLLAGAAAVLLADGDGGADGGLCPSGGLTSYWQGCLRSWAPTVIETTVPMGSTTPAPGFWDMTLPMLVQSITVLTRLLRVNPAPDSCWRAWVIVSPPRSGMGCGGMVQTFSRSPKAGARSSPAAGVVLRTVPCWENAQLVMLAVRGDGQVSGMDRSGGRVGGVTGHVGDDPDQGRAEIRKRDNLAVARKVF